jgi:hypothetical protein
MMGSKHSLQEIFHSNLDFYAPAALIVLMAFSLELFEHVECCPAIVLLVHHQNPSSVAGRNAK